MFLNYINGERVESSSKRTLPVFEPATGQEYNKVTRSNSKDVLHAIDIAHAAFPKWSKTSVRERAKIFQKIAAILEKKSPELAAIESKDAGKPITNTINVEIPRSVLNFQFFSEAITQFGAQSYFNQGDAMHTVLRQPLGVVSCISPWNLPLYLLTWKIAPALISGNTVIAKPSEVTPATADAFAQICQEAGLPHGVLNILHGEGSELGEALCTDPRIKAVSFTGSTATGRVINQSIAPFFKKSSLELGGKNASVVFADCDLEDTAAQVVRAAFSNQGQICLCGSRILIEKKIYSQFKELLIKETRKLVLGDPQEEKTQVGALVSDPHFHKVMSYVEQAHQQKLTFLTGGKRAQMTGRCKDGWFIEPTLLEGAAPESTFNQEEIFGPVATLIPFEDTADAIRIANQVRYGLSGSIWTNHIKKAWQVAEHLEAGILWINGWMIRDLRAPFGGVKESGMGREGGHDALRFFTEAKTVVTKL